MSGLAREREEVLNVVLAELLSDRDLLSIPESIVKIVRRAGGQPREERRFPDIIVGVLQGVRIVIEGRFDTSPGVRAGLLDDAIARVEEGISPVCLAVLYPPGLRHTDSLSTLRRRISAATLTVRVVSEGSLGDWTETTLDGLAAVLRVSYELLVGEDVVAWAVRELTAAIDGASAMITDTRSAPARLRAVLGIPAKETNSREEKEEDNLKVCRIAALTLVNAMIFQQVLAHANERIEPLGRTLAGTHAAESLIATWKMILEEIDYVPIFSTACDLLVDLSGNPGIEHALRGLALCAERITQKRAALRHDLMGRIYHRLLADAKYFGAFYTTVPAATLLLKLTLEPELIDWSDLEQMRKLRIGDPACGTGTLLKAALQTAIDNHVRARAGQGQKPSIPALHKHFIEECLWGLDVIPFAIHLAASALGMQQADVEFDNMHFATLPLSGGQHIKLGSLELLLGKRVSVQADLFGAHSGPGRLKGKGDQVEKIAIPPLDLCVMNPPFTRSVGGNLLFGHAPARQRTRMQAALKKMVREERVAANITAGLGSVFVALGHQLVKPGGHLALVLPRALLSGVAWQYSRRLVGPNYHVRYIVVSNEPGGWNFSENTKLSECLIVARRLRESEQPGKTKCINLWKRPTSSVEAVVVAELIRQKSGVSIDKDKGVESIETNGQKFGEVIVPRVEDIKAGRWMDAVAFGQTELCRAAFHLARGRLYLPGRGHVDRLRMAPLSRFGAIGPDRRDIHDGFKPVDSVTEYPAFWGSDTGSIYHLEQTPNRYLSPLARAKEGRSLRDPHLLWSRAGRLLIGERLRLNTARLIATRVNQPVLSNTWWPISTWDHEGINAEDADRVLCLWFNSTLGVLSVIAARVETEGPWVDLKKPNLRTLPVLDLTALSAAQITRLLRLWEAVGAKPMHTLPELANDPVRREIDSEFGAVLDLSDSFDVLRRMLSRDQVLLAARWNVAPSSEGLFSPAFPSSEPPPTR